MQWRKFQSQDKAEVTAGVSAIGPSAQKIPATFINSDLSKEEKETRSNSRRRRSNSSMCTGAVLRPQQGSATASPNPHRPFLVVDEAHYVDQWGKDFRPEYGKLAQVRADLGSPPIMAFTVTAGKEMQDRNPCLARHSRCYHLCAGCRPAERCALAPALLRREATRGNRRIASPPAGVERGR